MVEVIRNARARLVNYKNPVFPEIIVNVSNTVRELITDKDWENILSNVIFVVAAIMLLVGIFQERYKLFTPYLILQGLGVIYTIFAFFIVIILSVVHGQFNVEWSDSISIFIIWGFEVYFFYVVYNYFDDISGRLPR